MLGRITFRFEKAAEDKEKIEESLKRKPLPSSGPEIPSTVSLTRSINIYYTRKRWHLASGKGDLL